MGLSRRMVAAAAVLDLAVVASGCAYGYRAVTKAPPSLAAVEEIDVRVKNGGTATPNEVAQMAQAIVDELRATGRYTRVTAAADSQQDVVASDLRVEAEILDIKRVSAFLRVMVGAFAGRGWIQLRVSLYGGSSGTLLGEADIEGFSSGGTIFAGTTDQAIDEAAKKVAELVMGEA